MAAGATHSPRLWKGTSKAVLVATLMTSGLLLTAQSIHGGQHLDDAGVVLTQTDSLNSGAPCGEMP